MKNLDESKLKRQEQFINTWVKAGGKGTLEAVTAFGKTYTSVLIFKRMLAKNPNRTFVIVVPTIQLKEQWEFRIKESKLPQKHFKVFVINGLTVKQMRMSCTMLVLDEVHLYLNGPVFSTVFQIINYKFILGLSATIDRNADGYNILAARCPIIDTITQQEANANGWVATYKEFVLRIKLNEEQRAELDSINSQFKNYFSKFNFDFRLAMNCMSDRVLRTAYARERGWDVGMSQTHPWSPNKIAFYSVQFNRAMRLRKTFLYDIEQKKEAVKQLVEKFDSKAIVFSESTAFADDVAERIGDKAVAYHSNLETQMRRVKLKNGKTKLTKFGKTRLKKEAISKFEDGRSKITVLSTAKALNQGADLPSAQLGIIASYTSSALTSIQRRGRVIRKYFDKDGKEKKSVIVYFAVENSQEEVWLKKALVLSVPIWTDSIDYIYENAFSEDIFVQED